MKEPVPRRLLQANVVVLLVAMLVVIPVLMPFTHGVTGRALRNGLFQSIAVLLAVVLLARIDLRGGGDGQAHSGGRPSLSRLRYLAGSGVNAPLAAFMVWAALGALRAPDGVFAMGEVLRLGTGALVYFAAALHLETRAQLCLLIDCLLGLVILAIGYGCFFQAKEVAAGMSSIFPSRHHLSAILAVLFPLILVLALAEGERKRRTAAIAAATLGGIGLLLCLERGAWIAVVVGLLAAWFLAERSAPRGRPRRAWRLAAAAAAGGLLVTVIFFGVTDVGAVVAGRTHQISAATRGRDPSFRQRVQKWRGAAAMVAERPFWGWGPGQFVLHQLPYTRIGLTPDLVRPYGASFEEMAYSEYLQTAAELGLPGLALYLLILATFFSKAARALRRLPDGLRRTTLLGCAAGVVAQMVDAAANASWRYAECSIFFWLVLGLGVAMIRMAYRPAPEKTASPTVSADDDVLPGRPTTSSAFPPLTGAYLPERR